MSDFMVLDGYENEDDSGDIIDLQARRIDFTRNEVSGVDDDEMNGMGDAASQAAKAAAKAAAQAAKAQAQQQKEAAKAAAQAAKAAAASNPATVAAKAAQQQQRQQQHQQALLQKQANKTARQQAAATGNLPALGTSVDPSIPLPPLQNMGLMPLIFAGLGIAFLFFIASPGTGSANE